MKILDGASAPALPQADVCVVGAGPVGLSLAIGLVRRGLKVVLFEAGPRRPAREPTSSPITLIDSRQAHAAIGLATCRALGGASWLWGGRCDPLEPSDFENRRWVPDGKWPIAEADVAPFYVEAAGLVGCGSADFREPDGSARPWEQRLRGGLRIDTLERWCNEPILVNRLDDLAGSGSLTIVLNSTVTGLALKQDLVIGVKLEFVSGSMLFDRADNVVVACGGIETARLMLTVRRDYPAVFDGSASPLGRCYMGHLSGTIASIAFEDPAAATLFDYQFEGHSTWRRRLTLAPTVREAEGLPNVSFYPDNPRMYDPAHRSGVLSAIFLLLSFPPIGRRIVSEAIREMQMTKTPRYGAHVRNILLDLPNVLITMANLGYQRIIRRRRKPSLFLKSAEGVYPLHYHGEQLPDPDSRIWLDDETRAEGLGGIRIDLRFSERDAQGILKAHEALDTALQKSGLGRLRYNQDPDQRLGAVMAQARDGYHQIGVARMGANSSDGVVDGDCRVFGLRNLYLAGSSVFRTSGEANPTFFAVALALRLAEHLTRNVVKRTDAP